MYFIMISLVRGLPNTGMASLYTSKTAEIQDRGLTSGKYLKLMTKKFEPTKKNIGVLSVPTIPPTAVLERKASSNKY